ncbi:hypothetical protein T492DRAFT_890138 [Pavlovales sp. CCMP2436]|nr:hypothetical protein T492DRAFT_890138 [Pavlovales sp. CCMP2436]
MVERWLDQIDPAPEALVAPAREAPPLLALAAATTRAVVLTLEWWHSGTIGQRDAGQMLRAASSHAQLDGPALAQEWPEVWEALLALNAVMCAMPRREAAPGQAQKVVARAWARVHIPAMQDATESVVSLTAARLDLDHTHERRPSVDEYACAVGALRDVSEQLSEGVRLAAAGAAEAGSQNAADEFEGGASDSDDGLGAAPVAHRRSAWASAQVESISASRQRAASGKSGRSIADEELARTGRGSLDKGTRRDWRAGKHWARARA